MIETESRTHRPLSYEDLRRFLLLVVSMCLLTVVAVALAKIVSLFVVVFFLAMVLNPIVVWRSCWSCWDWWASSSVSVSWSCRR